MVTARRAREAITQELSGTWSRLNLSLALTRLIPDLSGNRLRAVILRTAGVAVGHGTVVGGDVRIVGRNAPHTRFSIGQRGWVNAGCYFDASDRIEIGDDVAIGQQVLVLTMTHEVAGSSRRAGALRCAPVRIGDGCWIGARAVILPGVTIGPGAVVAAGAVVRSDVPADTLVGGVPAAVVKPLDADVRDSGSSRDA